MAIIKKPEPGQLKVDRLRNLYLSTEQKIIKEITRKRNLGLVDYGEVAALERVQKILTDMQDEANEYVPSMIKQQFYTRNDLPSAPQGYENALALTSTQTGIVERLIENLMYDIGEASDTAYKSAENFLTLGRLEADKFRMLTLEEVAKLEAEGKGWNTIQRQMAAKLEAKGITSFVDKAGRQWGLTQYCSMATRTTQRQAQVAAALTEDDWDLWQISKIGSTCPLCSVYEGRVYSKSGTDPDYPPLTMAFGKIDPSGINDLSNTYLNIHPNCLVPGGSVLCEGIMSESRRFYSGEVITLQTSGGDKITVTPNHPILTERGFVAAGKIQKGDKIIKATRKYRSLIGKAPNNIDVPTVIDEKFHSVLKSLSGSTYTVKGSAVQFHGDGGTDSEINVIFADGLRENIVNALRSEPIGKNAFPSAHHRRLSFFTDSTFFKVFKRTFSSLYGRMSSFGFICSIKRVTENRKKFSNQGHRTATNFSDLGVRFPFVMKLKESGKKLFVRFLKSFAYIGKLLPAGSTRGFEHKFTFGKFNIPFRNAEFISNLPSSESLLKKRIKSLWVKNAFVESSVTHIDTSYYNGYVYNIETRYGFYVYNNIVTHNCLHTLMRYTTAGKTPEQVQRDKDFSSFEKRPANEDYRSKKQINAYRQKENARAEYRRNMKQFKEYQAGLGKDFPKTFETFEKHKKLNDDVYKEWERRMREGRKALNEVNAEAAEALTNKPQFVSNIDFNFKGQDEKYAKSKDIILKLEQQYNTRLQSVSIGAENAAGDVDITGEKMRLSSNAPKAAIHEFAHTLANSDADKYGLTNHGDFWKEIDSIRRKYRKDVGQDTTRWISSYANSHGKDEFLAEAFTQAKLKELGLPISSEYGNDFTYSQQVLNTVNKFFGRDQNLFTNIAKSDIINGTQNISSQLLRKKKNRDVQPMPKSQLNRIVKAFKRQGGIIKMDAEAQEMLELQGADGVTLNDKTILLRKRPTRAEVFEELIHATQFRNGEIKDGIYDTIVGEIKAKEKLLKFKKSYKLTDKEIRDTEKQLEMYREELRNMQY